MSHYTNTSRDTFARHSRLGITLIEMMVALAITTFVILVVNQLFNSVTQTVARGTQASELLQKSRTIDEQLAFETALDNSTFNDQTTPDSAKYAQWHSRMVGPAGRNGTGVDGNPTNSDPGGVLAIVQRVINAPLTFEDAQRGVTRPIRSDQLMYFYDQKSPLDAEDKRMPTMAPSSRLSFTGDQRDSLNADYVRMWYGHVVQIPEGMSTTDIDLSSVNNYNSWDLGYTSGTTDTQISPNILAQDWVLGRHALFLSDPSLTDSSLYTSATPPTFPFGPFVVAPFAIQKAGITNNPMMANGVVDVTNSTLHDLIYTGYPAIPEIGLNSRPSLLNYQNTVLNMMFTRVPLLTANTPVSSDPTKTTEMEAWDYAPTHTYFMGGVSDFIVEFAGDLVTDSFYQITTPTLQIQPDGELDRDPEGRIKWYSAYANSKTNNNSAIPNPDQPMTYLAPDPSYYKPSMIPNAMFTRADYAFIWTHKSSTAVASEANANFTQWPWMLRIRYRLHDRRGDFEGRQITVNAATGQTEPEPGVWYETILPVNYQSVE